MSLTEEIDAEKFFKIIQSLSLTSTVHAYLEVSFGEISNIYFQVKVAKEQNI